MRDSGTAPYRRLSDGDSGFDSAWGKGADRVDAPLPRPPEKKPGNEGEGDGRRTSHGALSESGWDFGFADMSANEAPVSQGAESAPLAAFISSLRERSRQRRERAAEEWEGAPSTGKGARPAGKLPPSVEKPPAPTQEGAPSAWIRRRRGPR